MGKFGYTTRTGSHVHQRIGCQKIAIIMDMKRLRHHPRIVCVARIIHVDWLLLLVRLTRNKRKMSNDTNMHTHTLTHTHTHTHTHSHTHSHTCNIKLKPGKQDVCVLP